LIELLQSDEVDTHGDFIQVEYQAFDKAALTFASPYFALATDSLLEFEYTFVAICFY